MVNSLRLFESEIFQVLAHHRCTAFPDLLREGEFSADTFSERPNMKQVNLSRHLAVLRNKLLVRTQKADNQVFYSVRDPLIWKILDPLRCYFQKQPGESIAMLKDTENEEVRR